MFPQSEIDDELFYFESQTAFSRLKAGKLRKKLPALLCAFIPQDLLAETALESSQAAEVLPLELNEHSGRNVPFSADLSPSATDLKLA